MSKSDTKILKFIPFADGKFYMHKVKDSLLTEKKKSWSALIWTVSFSFVRWISVNKPHLPCMLGVNCCLGVWTTDLDSHPDNNIVVVDKFQIMDFVNLNIKLYVNCWGGEQSRFYFWKFQKKKKKFYEIVILAS